MKALERIFLYSVLAVLVFYVFLVDNKVESKGAIQEEIRARMIAIVNDEGQEVVILWTNKDGIGLIAIANKTATIVADMTPSEDGDGRVSISNKAGMPVVDMRANKGDGVIAVYNRYGKGISSLP